MDSVPTILTGSYDPRLVALSIVIAVLAAGAALDLSGRVTSALDGARFWWLTGGAAAMGFGIWSMHYIGMLAFRLPVEVAYDWPTVLWSLLAAVGASWVALFVVSRETMTLPQAIVGALFMGGGIAAMHYLGMEAMRLPATYQYSDDLVKLSIILAAIIAFVALQMSYAFRGGAGWSLYKVGTAVTLGAAIPIMHYVGMAAVTFVETPAQSVDLRHALAISDLGVLSIATITLIVLGLVFLTSTVDRKFSTQSEALETSEQRFRLIAETALDAFLQIDPEGVITEWNARAEELFGWQRFEAVGRKVDSMFVLDDQARGTRRLREMLHTSEPGNERIEVAARRRDGREFPVEMIISAVWLGTRFIYAVFVHDVSERKRAESDREAAKLSAEAGNRAKTEFLANMSHEIRTPMNGVIGMSELLLDTPLDAMQRDYAQNIRDSAGALLTVINDILDFSKMESGKLELEELHVDLRDTFEDVTRLLAPEAHAKGLELTALIDPQLPPLVKADAGRVRQMILNLLGNAIKFTRQGEVGLEVEVRESGSRGTLVRCAVRDTGIGVSAQRVEQLFVAFCVGDAGTRELHGAGIGLSVVRKLAELMGGETGVDSSPGVGSTFWFTAWFGNAEQPLQLFSSNAARLNGQRVLLVDDNATNRKVLMGQLMQCGVDPMSAASADEALMLMRHAAAARRPFDAALLDQQMPDGGGAELGRVIMDDDALNATRLVLLTSTGQRGEGQTFAELGFSAYLLKPVSQRDLTDCLMLVLGSAAETWRTRTLPMITRHGLRAQRPR